MSIPGPHDGALDALDDRFPIRRRELAMIAAFWALFALVTIANRLLDPRRPLAIESIQYWTVAAAVLQSTLWALCTPLLFHVAARLGGERGYRVTNVLLALAAAVIVAMLVSTLQELVRHAAFPEPPRRGGRFGGPRRGGGGFGPFGSFQLLNDLVIALGVLMAGLARAYSLRLRARQELATRLQAQLAEARLDALRRQLDPHFLFNTLHAVSSLVERDPRGVRRMISRLSELLRHSIEGAAVPEIPLRQELELLGRYVDIMQVRFQGKLTVEQAVDERALDALVPNLILQPLVENAIRHGVEQLAEEGRIAISAALDGGDLLLRVQDNGPGAERAPAGAAPSAEGGGVGLRNTRARLAQLYGAAARFTLMPAPGGGTVAEVRIPFHTRAVTDAAPLGAGVAGAAHAH